MRKLQMALAQCPGNWRMVTCFSCFHIGMYFVIISICISITVASYSTILIKLFFHIFTSPFIFHLHGQNERSALFLKIHCALVLLCRAFDIDKPYSMRFFVLHICYGEFSLPTLCQLLLKAVFPLLESASSLSLGRKTQ